MNSTGAAEHTPEYQDNFHWLHSKAISRETNYRQRKIREALEVRKAKLDENIKSLNRVEGNLVRKDTWTPLLVKIRGTAVPEIRNQNIVDIN